MKNTSEELKKRIHEEMLVDYSNALEKNFDLAKSFIRVTKEGKIDVIIKDKISGKEKILLYLIGKLYSKEVGFSDTDDVGNNELMYELGIPGGSLRSWLTDLRKNQIIQVKRGKYVHHKIMINMVERTLKAIEKKLTKTS